MPTVLEQGGFKFMIYVDDHAPAHVHVRRGDTSSKLLIGSEAEGASLVWNGGMRNLDLRIALRLVNRNRAMLLAAWRKYHG